MVKEALKLMLEFTQETCKRCNKSILRQENIPKKEAWANSKAGENTALPADVKVPTCTDSGGWGGGCLGEQR